MPQEPRQKTAKTQPYPVGDAIMPQCAQPFGGYEKAGCLFEPAWEEPALIQPLALHDRLTGRPGRITGLVKFLDHITTRDRVWIGIGRPSHRVLNSSPKAL